MKDSQVRWLGLLGATIILALAYPIAAQKDKKVPEADIYRATPVPDRIILTWSGNPATTAAVTWRTDASVTNAVAQIANAADGPDFPKSARSYPAITETGADNYHSLPFTGLQPDTQYLYRVGDGANWSEWNQFRTAPRGPAPLEFIYVGDAQNDIFSMWSHLIRAGYSEAPRARFILHAGDLANRGVVDSEWGEWHAAAGWINLFDGETTFGLASLGDTAWKADGGNLVCETGTGGWIASNARFAVAHLGVGRNPFPPIHACHPRLVQ